MDFDLSDEQSMLQDTVRRFLDTEAPPGRLVEIYDADEGMDRRLWKKLADLGLTAIPMSEVYGGAELELINLAVAAEILGWGALPGPFLGHVVTTLAIALGGSEEQKRRWLPKLASGEIVASIAWAEEGNRWQPDEWTLRPTHERLTGWKNNVLFATEADLFLMGLDGGELGLVERGAPGLVAEEMDGIDRTRRIGRLSLEDTPAELVESGRGVSGRVRDAALVLLAADAFGGASRSVDMMVDYAKTREQFGKTIGHFQAVKHQIADVATRVEPARGLYWYAAHAWDRGFEDSERVAAIAKAHLTDCFVAASRKMVEIHGGIGYTWEFPAHVWVKRAMLDRAYLGGPSLHRERAAALAPW